MREGPSGKKFDDAWREIPDDTPVSVSVNLRPKSMEQMVATYVAQAMALESRMRGEESTDDAEDLEVDDEGESEVLTPYELHAIAAEAEREARRRAWMLEQIKGRKKKEEKAGTVPAPSAGAAPAPSGGSVVEVPPTTPAPPTGGSGGGEKT